MERPPVLRTFRATVMLALEALCERRKCVDGRRHSHLISHGQQKESASHCLSVPNDANPEDVQREGRDILVALAFRKPLRQ